MMSVLSPDNERFLRELVTQGEFASETEAINAAVGLLRKRQCYFAEIQAGIEQANGGRLIPANEVFERLERRAGEIDKLAGS